MSQIVSSQTAGIYQQNGQDEQVLTGSSPGLSINNIAFNKPVQAGSLLVVAVTATLPFGGFQNYASSITDALGLSWFTTEERTNNTVASIYYAWASVGGNESMTVGYSTNNSGYTAYVSWEVYEIRGALNYNTIGQTGNGTSPPAGVAQVINYNIGGLLISATGLYELGGLPTPTLGFTTDRVVSSYSLIQHNIPSLNGSTQCLVNFPSSSTQYWASAAVFFPAGILPVSSPNNVDYTNQVELFSDFTIPSNVLKTNIINGQPDDMYLFAGCYTYPTLVNATTASDQASASTTLSILLQQTTEPCVIIACAVTNGSGVFLSSTSLVWQQRFADSTTGLYEWYAIADSPLSNEIITLTTSNVSDSYLQAIALYGVTSEFTLSTPVETTLTSASSTLNYSSSGNGMTVIFVFDSDTNAGIYAPVNYGYVTVAGSYVNPYSQLRSYIAATGPGNNIQVPFSFSGQQLYGVPALIDGIFIASPFLQISDTSNQTWNVRLAKLAPLPDASETNYTQAGDGLMFFEIYTILTSNIVHSTVTLSLPHFNLHGSGYSEVYVWRLRGVNISNPFDTDASLTQIQDLGAVQPTITFSTINSNTFVFPIFFNEHHNDLFESVSSSSSNPFYTIIGDFSMGGYTLFSSSQNNVTFTANVSSIDSSYRTFIDAVVGNGNLSVISEGFTQINNGNPIPYYITMPLTTQHSNEGVVLVALAQADTTPTQFYVPPPHLIVDTLNTNWNIRFEKTSPFFLKELWTYSTSIITNDIISFYIEPNASYIALAAMTCINTPPTVFDSSFSNPNLTTTINSQLAYSGVPVSCIKPPATVFLLSPIGVDGGFDPNATYFPNTPPFSSGGAYYIVNSAFENVPIGGVTSFSDIYFIFSDVISNNYPQVSATGFQVGTDTTMLVVPQQHSNSFNLYVSGIEGFDQPVSIAYEIVPIAGTTAPWQGSITFSPYPPLPAPYYTTVTVNAGNTPPTITSAQVNPNPLTQGANTLVPASYQINFYGYYLNGNVIETSATPTVVSVVVQQALQYSIGISLESETGVTLSPQSYSITDASYYEPANMLYLWSAKIPLPYQKNIWYTNDGLWWLFFLDGVNATLSYATSPDGQTWTVNNSAPLGYNGNSAMINSTSASRGGNASLFSISYDPINNLFYYAWVDNATPTLINVGSFNPDAFGNANNITLLTAQSSPSSEMIQLATNASNIYIDSDSAGDVYVGARCSGSNTQVFYSALPISPNVPPRTWSQITGIAKVTDGNYFIALKHLTDANGNGHEMAITGTGTGPINIVDISGTLTPVSTINNYEINQGGIAALTKDSANTIYFAMPEYIQQVSSSTTFPMSIGSSSNEYWAEVGAVFNGVATLYNVYTSSSSSNLTSAISVTQGRTYICAATQSVGSSNTSMTISDSLGNTWTLVGSIIDTSSGQYEGAAIWYMIAANTGIDTVTVTTIGTRNSMAIYEVSGVNYTSESQATGNGTSISVSNQSYSSGAFLVAATGLYSSGSTQNGTPNFTIDINNMSYSIIEHFASSTITNNCTYFTYSVNTNEISPETILNTSALASPTIALASIAYDGAQTLAITALSVSGTDEYISVSTDGGTTWSSFYPFDTDEAIVTPALDVNNGAGNGFNFAFVMSQLENSRGPWFGQNILSFASPTTTLDNLAPFIPIRGPTIYWASTGYQFVGTQASTSLNQPTTITANLLGAYPNGVSPSKLFGDTIEASQPITIAAHTGTATLPSGKTTTVTISASSLQSNSMVVVIFGADGTPGTVSINDATFNSRFSDTQLNLYSWYKSITASSYANTITITTTNAVATALEVFILTTNGIIQYPASSSGISLQNAPSSYTISVEEQILPSFSATLSGLTLSPLIVNNTIIPSWQLHMTETDFNIPVNVLVRTNIIDISQVPDSLPENAPVNSIQLQPGALAALLVKIYPIDDIIISMPPLPNDPIFIQLVPVLNAQLTTSLADKIIIKENTVSRDSPFVTTLSVSAIHQTTQVPYATPVGQYFLMIIAQDAQQLNSAQTGQQGGYGESMLAVSVVDIASIVISPTSVASGTATISVSGAGFTPSSSISITLSEPNGTIISPNNPPTVTTDTLGSFPATSYSFSIPVFSQSTTLIVNAKDSANKIANATLIVT